jgi:hypothetical protein
MLDVSDEDSYNEGVEIAQALSRIDAVSYEERKRLAATSDDPALLTVLSDLDDSDVERLLLMNSSTPNRALTTIARRQCKRLMPPQPSDYEVTKDEAAVLDVIRHPNVDSKVLEILSRQHNWAIRYAVAMKNTTPTQILNQLAKDENLAVRAMASSRLSIPVREDEDVEWPISCSQLNKMVGALIARLSSCIDLADEASADMGFAEKYEYRLSDEFRRECVKAFSELRDRIIARYVAMVRQECFPNLDTSRYDFARVMAAFGEMHFDAYLIAVKLEDLMQRRSTIAMAELLSKARSLLPYVKGEPPLSSWEPASKPEQILNRARLKLQAFVRSVSEINSAYPEFETVEQIAALGKVSKVVLSNADPATVTSNISRILHDMRTPREVFRKIRIGEPCGILAVRFYRNHRFDVEYANEESARKVAEALVSRSKNSATS